MTRNGVLIITDMEGVSGIADRSLVATGSPSWEHHGRALLTDEVNTTAATLRMLGVERLLLMEAHNFGLNVLPERLVPLLEMLPPFARLASSWSESAWIEFLESLSGVVLLGYHAMQGAEDFLAHTFQPDRIKRLSLNATPIGEIAYFAALAGSVDVPVLAMIGSQAAVDEAQQVLPDTRTVATKVWHEGGDVLLRSVPRVHEEIAEAIVDAHGHQSGISPFAATLPIELDVTLRRSALPASDEVIPGAERRGKTVTFGGSRFTEAHVAFWDFTTRALCRQATEEQAGAH